MDGPSGRDDRGRSAPLTPLGNCPRAQRFLLAERSVLPCPPSDERVWVTLRRTTQSFSFSFADNAIDLSVIRDLTDQDLKDLGVLLGHRRKILRAITELDGTVPPATDFRFRVVVLQAWQCRCGATDPWESG